MLPHETKYEFLTPTEVFQITGYKQPSKQREWLEKRGVPAFINGANEVKVESKNVEKLFGFQSKAMPNFDAIA